jgi:hypothetical protein
MGIKVLGDHCKAEVGSTEVQDELYSVIGEMEKMELIAPEISENLGGRELDRLTDGIIAAEDQVEGLSELLEKREAEFTGK